MISRKLIKAGLSQILNSDTESFIDRLSAYLEDKDAVINYLIDGPLLITKEIEETLTRMVIDELPSPEHLKKIIEIKSGFDYCHNQEYIVTYKATRYYDEKKSPYDGVPVQDEEHQYASDTIRTLHVNPSYINH